MTEKEVLFKMEAYCSVGEHCIDDVNKKITEEYPYINKKYCIITTYTLTQVTCNYYVIISQFHWIKIRVPKIIIT